MDVERKLDLPNPSEKQYHSKLERDLCIVAPTNNVSVYQVVDALLRKLSYSVESSALVLASGSLQTLSL